MVKHREEWPFEATLDFKVTLLSASFLLFSATSLRISKWKGLKHSYFPSLRIVSGALFPGSCFASHHRTLPAPTLLGGNMHRLPSGCKRCLGRWRAQSSQFNSQTQTWCPMKNPSLTEERHSVSWNPVVTDIAGVAKQFGLRERMHCCVSIGALLSLISHCVVFKWVSVSLYKWSFWFYDCPLAVPQDYQKHSLLQLENRCFCL